MNNNDHQPAERPVAGRVENATVAKAAVSGAYSAHFLVKNERCDIVLLYAARTEQDLVFRDVFEEAGKIGLRNGYILSEADKVPPLRQLAERSRTGRLDADMIKAEVPDANERIFYISGPEPMMEGVSKTLLGMGIPRSRIKRDYFPGYT